MSNGHFGHSVAHAFRDMDRMPAVGEGKSAFLAFVLGVLFGPFGVGIYLKSWMDFFVLLAIVVFGAMFTVGIGAPVFWIVCGVWGAVRVAKANA